MSYVLTHTIYYHRVHSYTLTHTITNTSGGSSHDNRNQSY